MFSWATKEYLLDCMSIEQVIYYYNVGWEAKQTECRVNWGILGSLLNGDASKNEGANDKHIDPGEITLEKLQRYYPDAHYDENGKIVHS